MQINEKIIDVLREENTPSLTLQVDLQDVRAATNLPSGFYAKDLVVLGANLTQAYSNLMKELINTANKLGMSDQEFSSMMVFAYKLPDNDSPPASPESDSEQKSE